MRVSADIVRPVAGQLVQAFEPGCQRVEIAGSLRRGSETVGDLEIVAMPKLVQALNLWGEPDGPELSELDPILARLVNDGTLAHGLANGDRQKKFILKPLLPKIVKLDLFIVRPPAQWGAIFAIRTGPAEFSRKLITDRSKGGYKPSHLTQRNGALWDGGQLVQTPTEQSYFDALGLDWIEPGVRA